MEQARRLLWCALCCAGLLGCQTATETSDEQLAQQNYSEIPLSQSEADDLRAQIEWNWNIGGSLAASPNLEDAMVKLRITLLPDGTVTKTELLNTQPDNPDFNALAESAVRAVMISSPLKLAPGKRYESLVLTFHPGEVLY